LSRSVLLEERILSLLQRIRDPIPQSQIARVLNVDSRLVSRALARLARSGKIRRNYVMLNGRRLLVVYPLKTEKPTEISDIPCLFCPNIDRCGLGQSYDPTKCPKLTAWLLKNARKED